MPRSTATMVPSASTNRLPGCMSAWKKPSRSVWRRNDWTSVAAIALRSWPAARKARDVGQLDAVDPVHGETSRPVRSQSTAGTRKPGSSRVFSASSESAAASSRRSISILVVWARASVICDRAQPPRRRDVALLQPRGEEIAFEVAQEQAAHARPDHLDGDLHGLAVAHDGRRMHLRDRGGGDRLAEALVELADRPAERAPRSPATASAFGKVSMRSCSMARSSAMSVPTTSGRVARNWPSFT